MLPSPPLYFPYPLLRSLPLAFFHFPLSLSISLSSLHSFISLPQFLSLSLSLSLPLSCLERERVSSTLFEIFSESWKIIIVFLYPCLPSTTSFHCLNFSLSLSHAWRGRGWVPPSPKFLVRTEKLADYYSKSNKIVVFVKRGGGSKVHSSF